MPRVNVERVRRAFAAAEELANDDAAMGPLSEREEAAMPIVRGVLRAMADGLEQMLELVDDDTVEVRDQDVRWLEQIEEWKERGRVGSAPLKG